MKTTKKLLAEIEKKAEKIHQDQGDARKHNAYFTTLTTNKSITFLVVIIPAILLGWHVARIGFLRKGIKQLPRLLAIGAFEALRSQLLKKIAHSVSNRAYKSASKKRS